MHTCQSLTKRLRFESESSKCGLLHGFIITFLLFHQNRKQEPFPYLYLFRIYLAINPLQHDHLILRRLNKFKDWVLAEVIYFRSAQNSLTIELNSKAMLTKEFNYYIGKAHV